MQFVGLPKTLIQKPPNQSQRPLSCVSNQQKNIRGFKKSMESRGSTHWFFLLCEFRLGCVLCWLFCWKNKPRNIACFFKKLCTKFSTTSFTLSEVPKMAILSLKLLQKAAYFPEILFRKPPVCKSTFTEFFLLPLR